MVFRKVDGVQKSSSVVLYCVVAQEVMKLACLRLSKEIYSDIILWCEREKTLVITVHMNVGA